MSGIAQDSELALSQQQSTLTFAEDIHLIELAARRNPARLLQYLVWKIQDVQAEAKFRQEVASWKDHPVLDKLEKALQSGFPPAIFDLLKPLAEQPTPPAAPLPGGTLS